MKILYPIGLAALGYCPCEGKERRTIDPCDVLLIPPALDLEVT